MHLHTTRIVLSKVSMRTKREVMPGQETLTTHHPLCEECLETHTSKHANIPTSSLTNRAVFQKAMPIRACVAVAQNEAAA